MNNILNELISSREPWNISVPNCTLALTRALYNNFKSNLKSLKRLPAMPYIIRRHQTINEMRFVFHLAYRTRLCFSWAKCTSHMQWLCRGVFYFCYAILCFVYTCAISCAYYFLWLRILNSFNKIWINSASQYLSWRPEPRVQFKACSKIWAVEKQNWKMKLKTKPHQCRHSIRL